MTCKKHISVAIFLSVLVTALISHAASIAWFRSSDFTVSCDGVAVRDAKIYRGRGNDILLKVRPRKPNSVFTDFIIHLREFDSSVDVSTDGYWWFFTELFALPKSDPPWEIDFRDVKADQHDPKIALTPNTISFLDEGGVQIRLEASRGSIWR